MIGRRVLRATLLGVLLLLLIGLLGRAGLARWAEKRWTAAATRYEQEVAGARAPVALRADAPIGSLDFGSWALPRVPDEENAATWIAKGSAAVVAGDKVTALASKSPAGWTPEETADLRRSVEQNREALAIVAHSRLHERSSFGIDIRDGAKASVPNLIEIMAATKLLFARAALSMKEEDRESAMADLELLGEVSRSLQQERVPVVLLVGGAVERLELRLVHAFAEDPKTTREDVARLQASLLRSDLLADYARTFAADGAALCTALREGESPPGMENASQLLRALRPAIDPGWAAACLDWFREWGGAAGRPHHEVRAALAGVEERWRSSWLMGGVASATLPNIVNSNGRMATNLALRQLAGAALAARAHAFESGAYPESIEALPGAGERDPLTGGRVQWRREADGSAVLEIPGAAEIMVELFPSDVASVTPWSFHLPPPGR